MLSYLTHAREPSRSGAHAAAGAWPPISQRRLIPLAANGANLMAFILSHVDSGVGVISHEVTDEGMGISNLLSLDY